MRRMVGAVPYLGHPGVAGLGGRWRYVIAPYLLRVDVHKDLAAKLDKVWARELRAQLSHFSIPSAVLIADL